MRKANLRKKVTRAVENRKKKILAKIKKNSKKKSNSKGYGKGNR